MLDSAITAGLTRKATKVTYHRGATEDSVRILEVKLRELSPLELALSGVVRGRFGYLYEAGGSVWSTLQTVRPFSFGSLGCASAGCFRIHRIMAGATCSIMELRRRVDSLDENPARVFHSELYYKWTLPVSLSPRTLLMQVLASID